jgi:hypothetical protein
MSRIDFANKLKAALESGTQAAAVVVEPVVPAVESTDLVAATEDLAGKAKGFVGGVLVTGAMNKKIEAKKAELHEIREKIKALKGNIHSAESYKLARESHQGEWTEALEGAYWEGVKKGHHGENIEGSKWWQKGHTTVTDEAGKMNEEIKHLDAAIAEAKTELSHLESTHKGAVESARQELSTELTQGLESFFAEEPEEVVATAVEEHASAAEPALEGTVGNVASTAIGALAGSNPVTGAIHGAYRGHKVEALHKEIREVEEEIAKTKREIAEISHGHSQHAATEGLVGGAGGAAVGAVTSLVNPIAGIAAGGAMSSVQHGLEGELEKKKKELERLKNRHIDLLRATREAIAESTADLESLIASAESEAVIAAPAGGTETIVADEAPHRVEDHLHAADACCDAMDSHLDEACKLHRAVAQLESLMAVVHSEPNGLNQTDAKYVTLAVEHITADFAADVKLVPSIETFAGPVSSQEATLTLEGNVKEVAAQIWAYLKELWAKFMAALKNMWGHLFGAAESLARKAKGLEAKANAVSGEPREASIDLGPLAHRVAVGGKVPASLNGILAFMKLGELKTIAMKALDESEISGAVQKMATGADTADSAVDASMREALKTMPILNRELPGGVMYTMGDDGKVSREVTGAAAGGTSIAVLSRVALVQLAHEAGALATDAAGVLKDLQAATAKDAGSFLTGVNIEDPAKASAVSHAVNVMVTERKVGLKLVADAITDYLKAAQALVEIGDKCAAKYGEVGIVEKTVDATKAAASTAADAASNAVDATKAAVSGAVDSAKAGAAAVAAKVNPAPAAPAAAA